MGDVWLHGGCEMVYGSDMAEDGCDKGWLEGCGGAYPMAVSQDVPMLA